MKKILGGLLLSFISCIAYCQDAKTLVGEGIAFHDEGKYEEAIQKYDAAIAVDDKYFGAYYEKSYSLIAAKKYDEAIALCKYMLKQFKAEPDMPGIYTNYGTCLDLQCKQKQALDVYDEGIKQ